MLVWAIGSLEGYTNRVELLCVEVDCVEEVANPIPVERAQGLLRVVSGAPSGSFDGGINIAALKTVAEGSADAAVQGYPPMFFGSRDNLLTEKARQAVHSHAQRQISRNDRQLQKEDLNVNLRNMYLGWNRRIHDETASKLAEVDQKSGVRSSLEIIGRGGYTSGWHLEQYSGDRRQLVLLAHCPHCLNKTVTQRKWLPQIKCYLKSGRQSRGRRH